MILPCCCDEGVQQIKSSLGSPTRKRAPITTQVPGEVGLHFVEVFVVDVVASQYVIAGLEGDLEGVRGGMNVTLEVEEVGRGKC